MDEPGNQVDLGDTGDGGQGPCQFHHIFGLPAGVSVPAEFEGMATNQAVDADELQIKAVVLHVFTLNTFERGPHSSHSRTDQKTSG